MARLIIFLAAIIIVSRFFSSFISPWASLFIIVPLIYVFSIYIELKAINKKIKPEPIGSLSGLKVRIRHLKKAAEKAKALGFGEYKVFWLKTFAPNIFAVFKHETEPLVLTVQHSGMRMIYEFRTYFDPTAVLDTSSRISSFIMPLLPGSFAQALQTEGLEELFKFHKQGEDFLKGRDYVPKAVTLDEHKGLYIEGLKETVKNTMKLEAWPIRIAWRMLTKYGKKYLKPVREQALSGMEKKGVKIWK